MLPMLYVNPAFVALTGFMQVPIDAYIYIYIYIYIYTHTDIKGVNPNLYIYILTPAMLQTELVGKNCRQRMIDQDRFQ